MTFNAIRDLGLELLQIRAHNESVKQGTGEDKPLIFAEAALVMMTLERFLRTLPGVNATDGHKLLNLLNSAVGKGLLTIPGGDVEGTIKLINRIRNATLHGNFEQSARDCEMTVQAYLTHVFPKEVLVLNRIMNNLLNQIEPETGQPKKKPT